jgi:UDP-N-acetylmuramate: L-alanyl-gamma-D-glutamyl-meso-diaminopimelate ligase
MAAWTACKVLELSDAEIFDAVETFQLPDKRMNTLVNDSNLRIIRDYAHAPSKVKASLSAFKQMARGAQMAILEIHTYSSLNRKFLPHYKNVFDGIDIPVLYYNPKNLEIKRLPSMDDEYIRESFGCPELRIFTRAEDLEHFVLDKRDSIHDILLMSSSNFGGIDWKRLK